MTGDESARATPPESSVDPSEVRVDSAGAALVYALGPVSGLLWLVLERDCPAVRYHSVECLGGSTLAVVSLVGLTFVQYLLTFLPSVGLVPSIAFSLAYPVYALVLIGVWLRLTYRVYQGKLSRFPLAWRIADRYGTHFARIETGR